MQRVTEKRIARRPGWKFSLVASLILVVTGATLIYFARSSGSSGPSISGPIGVTTQARSVPDMSPTTSPAKRPRSRACFVGDAVGCSDSLSSPVRPSLRKTDATSGASDISVQTSTPTTPSGHFAHVATINRSRPVHLSIAKLGVSVSVSELGLNRDGSVKVPTNVQQPGWYKLGPSPGQLGSAVILGHVDSYKGPAVFFHLAELRPGNKVVITLANGRRLTFKVIGLRMYGKGSFPNRVVFGRRKYSALQLVTCGGTFDRTTGHYESNLVVFTALVTH